jgi:DDE superfamily endonuclease
MPFSHLPAFLASCFARLATALDHRSAARLPALLCGLLFASGRRTCTSWFRAAGITDEFRRAYTTVWATGRRADRVAVRLLAAVDPLLPGKRLLLGIDDTPTKRYGPHVEGCGIHHNPTPGPAGQKFLYGHNWVSLAALAKHQDWGTVALPLLSELYIRHKDIARLDKDRQVPFRTKLELAARLLRWARIWLGNRYEEVWVVVDGGYSKRPFLRAARREGAAVVGRLPRNAALWSVPQAVPPERRGPGRPPTYGKGRLSLAKRAGQRRGWQRVGCVQYREAVTKTVKTFLATWRPAGGLIRVVLVLEEDGWRAYFCTQADATVAEILEAVADRGAHEQAFKDVKEVWGAAQQQVRNLHASVGCFNLCGWMYSLVEAWAWQKGEDELVDRSQSPWDNEPRRPSHQDKRKALRREVMRAEIEAALAGRPTKQEIRDLSERLLRMAG